jgi:hypothetical protein
MCKESNLKILSESEKGKLVYCDGCQNYTVYHGTFCITFGDRELEKFSIMLKRLEHSSYNIPMGEDHYVAISHPNVKMGLFLTPHDTDMLLDLMAEGKLFKQAINILQQ